MFALANYVVFWQWQLLSYESDIGDQQRNIAIQICVIGEQQLYIAIQMCLSLNCKNFIGVFQMCTNIVLFGVIIKFQ